MDTIVIGIAGGTGSGKTTLALKLKEAFSDDVVIASSLFPIVPAIQNNITTVIIDTKYVHIFCLFNTKNILKTSKLKLLNCMLLLGGKFLII